MIAKENPEAIEGRRRLIAVEVIDSEQAAEYASIDHDDADLYKDYGSGLVGAGVIKEMVDMQMALKSSSLS